MQTAKSKGMAVGQAWKVTMIIQGIGAVGCRLPDKQHADKCSQRRKGWATAVVAYLEGVKFAGSKGVHTLQDLQLHI